MSRFLSVLAILALLLGVSNSALATNTSLRKELGTVATQIKKLYDGENLDAISIGQFTGPPTLPSSSGGGIAQTLTEELQKIGCAVKKRAKYGIKGEYFATELDGPNGKEMAVKLKCSVADAFGKVLTDYEFAMNIKGETAYAEMLGVSVHITKKDDHQAVYTKLKQAYVEPKTYVDPGKTKTYPAPTSPYSVEIYVGGKARPVTSDEGVATCKLHKGERYTIRLYNNSPYEAACRLSIDGLNLFTFSEQRQHARNADPNYKPEVYHYEGSPTTYKYEPIMTHVLVPSYKYVELHGWYINSKQSDYFLVTEKGHGAADKLGHTQNLGTITAIFHASWTGDNRPPDEAPKARDPYNVELRTGFGGRFDQQFHYEQRHIGAVRASVSIRYSKQY